MLIRKPENCGEEIASKRTMFSKSFRRPDGKITCCASIRPIHVPADLGAYREGREVEWLDPSLRIARVGDHIEISGSWYFARVTDIGVDYTSYTGERTVMRFLDGNAESRIESDRVVWDLGDVEIYLLAKPSGVEWFKRLHSQNSRRTFRWSIEGAVERFVGHSAGFDNEDKAARNGRRFPLVMNCALSDGVYTETWTGEVIARDPATKVKFASTEAVYPVLIDATIQEDVVANTDDGNTALGYWRANGGTGSLNAIVIESGKLPAWRFQGVSIPQGATIDSATIDVEKQKNYGASVEATFHGEDVDSASEWTDVSANSPAAMTQTTASVLSNSGWGGTGQQSVTITSIIQEIINRAGWSTGNDLRVGVSAFGGSGYQYIDDYSGTTPVVGQLNVTYTASGGGGSTTLLERQTRGVMRGVMRGAR